MSAESMLDVRDLSVTFRQIRWIGPGSDSRPAVDGVSLEIGRGETLGLVGESGSGKTTLGRAILRLIEPESGTVRFEGVDVLAADRREVKRLRRGMQIVFQDPAGSLNPRLRIGEIVAEPLVVHELGNGRARQARAAELLERVGLSAAFIKRYPHELSGGQKQRVGIARALALSPKFVVLDEPVSALDVSVQAQILKLLGELKAELGLTYLLIAHNLAVVRRLCDKVAVMRDGQIVEVGATCELFERPRHEYTKELIAAVPGLRPVKREG